MKRLKSIKAKYVIAAMFLALIFLLGLKSLRTGGVMIYQMAKDRAQIETVLDKFESNLNANFPKKNAFVDLNGLFHRILLQREMNGVIRLKNGSESALLGNRSEEDIIANAVSLSHFSDWLNQKNIHMFYCQVPYKNPVGDNQLPTGLVDYSNNIADLFLDELQRRDVDYLDLRQAIVEDGNDSFSLFLNTEHHWNSYGGFYAFTKLCSFMMDHYGVQVDDSVLCLNNYYQDTYRSSSLGYYGQCTGFLFGGFDDFTVIYPRFETSQRCEIPHKEIVRIGSFREAVFDWDRMNLPWRERGLYGLWIGGDYPLVIHHSDSAKNQETILIFIDSFGTVPEAFLTTAFKDVVAVDLRWVLRTNMGKSAADFVEEYKPDVVIVMFNPSQIGFAESEQFVYGIE